LDQTDLDLWTRSHLNVGLNRHRKERLTGGTRASAVVANPGGRRAPESSGVLLRGVAFWCLLECFSPLFGPSFVEIIVFVIWALFFGILSDFPVKSLQRYKTTKLVELCQIKP
jgi:hypothetical protein